LEKKFHTHAKEVKIIIMNISRFLGLMTCSFKAQGVLDLSIFVLVFPYPAVPEVGTGKPSSGGEFCPFVSGDLIIYFDTILCFLLCCPF
jgi:hypothetical protein